MQIPGKSFLVVGGAGFIGSHVVDQLLDAGAARVKIYDNFSRGSMENLAEALRDDRTEIFEDGGDILHFDTLQKAMVGIDGVFHLAALWLLQCVEYPRSAFDVNVTGTMNVIQAVINSGVKRLIFSSSASVYGDALSEPIEEDHPYNCQEFYGASKVCGEMLLRALYNQQLSRNAGFEYIGLRYMNVYGPRQDDKGAYVGVIVKMLNALDAGENIVVHGDGSQSYDFVDVRDCARANILAMQAEISDSYYNVGTGIKTSIAEIAEKIVTLFPGNTKVSFDNVDRPYVKNRVGSIANAVSILGFVADYKLDDGLKDLIGWRNK